jgi:2-keto-3-deoxy-6-phosphogluconate aldolase
MFPADLHHRIKQSAVIAVLVVDGAKCAVPLALASYLTCPLIAAIGGSWIAPRDVIAARNWTTVQEDSKAARQIAEQIHKPAIGALRDR